MSTSTAPIRPDYGSAVGTAWAVPATSEAKSRVPAGHQRDE
ncbi:MULTISPECIES: hypothetical protein [Streptomyces]|uniref:Uncharacterized protein n=1 Tax=Streptomyces gibsoniae TaxID=3075529 RepID=A0ABU2U6S0_9ACTN|nr:hypothetical protein [Streptomyces sp. DSM 41699]MDT0468879.1 hypothetical protein [Streptomyces sp. DSM 41699]